MQHQTLPDAPTSNEGGENKDLLVILFARWCGTLATHTNVKGLGVMLPPLKGKQTNKECHLICQFPIWSKAGNVDFTF